MAVGDFAGNENVFDCDSPTIQDAIVNIKQDFTNTGNPNLYFYETELDLIDWLILQQSSQHKGGGYGRSFYGKQSSFELDDDPIGQRFFNYLYSRECLKVFKKNS